ncbi:immunity protein TriTu family protein [Lusitaniella coriacea]|uniref:immunity protein TriTu family protein n=1 Tax=Lusitaniella coriacea TaxID=1983105 RepID=UPI003CF38DB0
MLIEFERWLQTIYNKIQQNGYQIEVTKTYKDNNRSVQIDFDSENKIARITFWKTWNLYEYSLQVIEVDSEILLLNQYLEIASDSEFNKVFDVFFEMLGVKLEEGNRGI